MSKKINPHHLRKIGFEGTYSPFFLKKFAVYAALDRYPSPRLHSYSYGYDLLVINVL